MRGQAISSRGADPFIFDLDRLREVCIHSPLDEKAGRPVSVRLREVLKKWLRSLETFSEVAGLSP
jgi:hypothetical protein